MNNTIDGYRLSAERFRRSVKVSSGNFIDAVARVRYIDYLEHQIENSTRANIAMNEVRKKHPIDFPFTYEINMAKLEQDPEIKALTKTLSEKYSNHYPNTGEWRDLLIKENRVVFDKVTPALRGFKKSLLRLKATLKFLW